MSVGLCHRGLGSVSEARGDLAEAIAHREESLALIAEGLNPDEPEANLT